MNNSLFIKLTDDIFSPDVAVIDRALDLVAMWIEAERHAEEDDAIKAIVESAGEPRTLHPAATFKTHEVPGVVAVISWLEKKYPSNNKVSASVLVKQLEAEL